MTVLQVAVHGCLPFGPTWQRQAALWTRAPSRNLNHREALNSQYPISHGFRVQGVPFFKSYVGIRRISQPNLQPFA